MSNVTETRALAFGDSSLVGLETVTHVFHLTPAGAPRALDLPGPSGFLSRGPKRSAWSVQRVETVVGGEQGRAESRGHQTVGATLCRARENSLGVLASITSSNKKSTLLL